MPFHAARLTFAATVMLALPLQADPAPPFVAPGVTILDLGVYCRPGSMTREDAPGTTLGYIQKLEKVPDMAFRQQEVPARIGVHFGIVVVTDRDIAGVRAETRIPGAGQPEVWFTDHTAGLPRTRGFVFEYEHELVPGPWVMEAYDGSTLLYRVEWQVMPGSQLPGVSSDCDLLS